MCDIKIKEELTSLSHMEQNFIERKQNYELNIIKIGQFLV